MFAFRSLEALLTDRPRRVRPLIHRTITDKSRANWSNFQQEFKQYLLITFEEMNTRKYYLVVVTTDYSTCFVPSSPHFHIAMTSHWFYVISRSSHHLYQTFRQKNYGKRSTFAFSWSFEPLLLRFSMMFPFSVQILASRMPSTDSSDPNYWPAVLSAGSSARIFKIINCSRGNKSVSLSGNPTFQ